MSASFQGEQVDLVSVDPEAIAKAIASWSVDSEYFRLLDSEPPRLLSVKKIQNWFEEGLKKDDPNDFFFSIRLKQEDQVIGFTALFDLSWNSGDTLVSIAIGDRNHWGKGYGTEAMRLLLRYAFDELNLRRVTLLVFDYNQRAQRSYQKAGFVVEGRQRGMLLREGQRWDWLFMGVLKEDWLRLQEAQA